MKRCRLCDTAKSHSEFYKNSRRKDGLQSECKECKAAYNRQHYQDNKESYLDSARRNRGVAHKRHRLTEERYGELMELHGGLCYVCLAQPATVIDHDHSCCPGTHSCGGCVRGVLCSLCNSALGFFRDDIATMERAIAYIS